MSIFTSCEEGDLESLSSYLNNGGDPNATDKEGWTLLMLSCTSGVTSLVEKLLEYPVDVHARNKYDSSAIISASWNNDPEMVRLLLEKGANPNDADEDGITPLMQAMESGSTEIIDLLLRNGANPLARAKDGRTTLYAAAEKGNAYGVEKMIQLGVDPSLKDENNWDALYSAITWDKAEAVKALLENQVSPNVVYDYQFSPLMHAASNGKNEIVLHLLAFGAETNHRDEFGYTSLMRAALNGHETICAALLNYGADPDATTDDGETALEIAHREKQKSIVKLLESKTKKAPSAEKKETKKPTKVTISSGETFLDFQKKFPDFSFPDSFKKLCDMWDHHSYLCGSIELDLEAQDSLIAWFNNPKLNDKFIAFAIDGIHSVFALTNERKPAVVYLSGEGEGSCVLALSFDDFIKILMSGKEYSPFDKKYFDPEEDPNELWNEVFPALYSKKINPDKIRSEAMKKHKALQDWLDNYSS